MRKASTTRMIQAIRASTADSPHPHPEARGMPLASVARSFLGTKRRWLVSLAAALLAMVGSGMPAAGVAAPAPPPGTAFAAQLPPPCGYPYFIYSRFVIEDGGVDEAGNTIRLCSEHRRHGGYQVLGAPISRPFRVGAELYQAFQFSVLRWRPEHADAVLVDVLDVLHDAGRDTTLQRLGIPPRLEASRAWLTHAALRRAYGSGIHPLLGLPTSPPTEVGPYVSQRFQRGLLRYWATPVPPDVPGWVSLAPDDPGWVQRLMVGAVLRSSGLIPPAALVVADPGTGAEQYNGPAAPTVPEAFWSTRSLAVGGWDALFHRAGAFDVGTAGPDPATMRGEVVQATGLGLSLAVNGYVGRDDAVAQAAFDRNLAQISTYPWGRIAAACGEALQDHACTLSPEQLERIEQQVRRHLRVTREDEGVVGYWVLDDHPGDVRPALDLIHRLVQEDSVLVNVPRPTICGFGGDLDDARRPVAETRAAFDAALANFSPTGCDAVALYPYGRPGGPEEVAHIDWSMGELLPYMLARLREHGWEPARQPLLGIPQAFRFGDTPAPTAADVAAQTAAYCGSGASAILFYAWNDSYTGPKAALFNAPDLRQGALDGLAQCQAIWETASEAATGSP
jgi:hypothetical protein